MDRHEEELEQIATWLSEEGLASDAPKEAQLCVLWRAHQHTRSQLSSVLRDLDIQRSHLAEMAEEIQGENDQLKDQLQRLISLQDAQISEVAKMLYQQGLTELIHSSPSEQVAYLLVERASLLETREDPDSPTGGGRPVNLLGTDGQGSSTRVCQCPHKGAPRQGHSPWRRLFGLHKPSQSSTKAEARHLAAQASSIERECYRLERDLEEGSRRLAMAHSEIRRLTDELESAHLTQRAYEPELQGAQQEVEQLRQEVEKVKKYEMVELRKAKELNDRLDLEIRALRNRVRSLDAEKSSLQQTVASLEAEVDSMESALQEQQQLLTVKVQSEQATELSKSQAAELAQSNHTCRKLKEKLNTQTRCLLEKDETIIFLRKEVERLQSALQEHQQQLFVVQLQVEQANELSKSRATELSQSNEMCRNLQNKLSAQTRSLLENESEIDSLKQQLDNSQKDLDNIIASICTKENNFQDQNLWNKNDSQHCENSYRQLDTSFTPENSELQTLREECPDYQEALKALLARQDECETLKSEVCETLICLDKERSKYHAMKEKHKAKLCRAMQRFDDEATQRDEKIKNLERELSLCSHSLAKEKELIRSITVENEKLLVERRQLLQQLNEEEHNKKDSNLTASLSKCRVDFLEMENKKLATKIVHMSNQLSALERTLQSMQALQSTEELKKISNPQKSYTALPVQTSCFISAALSRSAEMGYLNLTSAQSGSEYAAPSSTPESTCS